MTNNQYEPRWRVIGQSVRGASHVRMELPNQDAIYWQPESETGPPLILAVSDGHGSAKCFRSDAGSRLAVNTAIEVLQEFLASLSELTGPSAVKRWTKDNLPREIVHRWRDAVADDLSDDPFTSAEMDQLEAQKSVGRRREAVLNPIIAYGATLLTVLVTETFILYLQLGDGDILTVSKTGEVSRPPLPADERLFANETTSLCSRDSWRDFRSYFQVITGPPPALILASTDGYANSFSDEAGFLQVGADILKMLRSDGLDTVNEEMKTWLTEVSQKGSGDDITLGILCRMNALELPAGGVPTPIVEEVAENLVDVTEPIPFLH